MSFQLANQRGRRRRKAVCTFTKYKRDGCIPWKMLTLRRSRRTNHSMQVTMRCVHIFRHAFLLLYYIPLRRHRIFLLPFPLEIYQPSSFYHPKATPLNLPLSLLTVDDPILSVFQVSPSVSEIQTFLPRETHPFFTKPPPTPLHEEHICCWRWYNTISLVRSSLQNYFAIFLSKSIKTL